MKGLYKISTILLCIMANPVSSRAQITTDSIAYLQGDALHTYISTQAGKAQYIDMLNARLQNSAESRKWGVRITDISMDSTQTFFAEDSTSTSRHVRRKASIFDAGDIFNWHNTLKYTYESVDGNNEQTCLSGIIYYYGEADNVKFGVLNSHPTVTSFAESPSGNLAPDQAIHAMYDEHCLVVSPDYCGYGISGSQQHPYLIQDVTARNCIDGYLAAIQLAKDALKANIVTGQFYTYFVGYSQGGSVALANQKLYESSVYSNQEKALINLKHTYCGDGPYSTYNTIKQYVRWANNEDPTLNKLAYPCVLPLISMAAKDAYDKDCMHTITLEDIFKKKFLEDTNIVEAIKSKFYTTNQLNQMIWDKGYYTIDQMLSDQIITVATDESGKKTIALNETSNAGKCLLRALKKNDLTTGWAPTIPITFLHYDGDLVVPYINCQIIQDLVSAGTWDSNLINFVEAKSGYEDDYLGIGWMIRTFKLKNELKSWNHVTVGTLFYCWFMFGDAR